MRSAESRPDAARSTSNRRLSGERAAIGAGDKLYTRNFIIASLVHFTGGMSTASFILFPLFVAKLGGDELVIGKITGIGAAAAVLTRPAAGHLLDRHGSRRVLLVGTLVNAISIGALLTVERISVGLALLFVVHSIAAGALFAAYFTYAAHIVPLARRTEGVAMFGVAGMLPNGLAPPLAEFLIAHFGYGALFASALSFSVASLLFASGLDDSRARSAARDAVTPPQGATRQVEHRESWFRLVARPELRAILIATLCFGLGIAALFTFLAPYAHATGRGPVGPFFFGYAAAAIVTRLVGSRLPDRVGPRRIVLPAMLAYGVGLLLVSFTTTPAMLIMVGFICGAGHGYIFPILNVLVVARTPAAVRGAAVSLYTAMVDLGTMIGGPLLGALAQRDFHLMYVFAAGVLGVGAAVLAFTDRPGLVGEDQ